MAKNTHGGMERDWWDKASIISQFLSSVVIAVIGIVISSSLNRSQIASSEAMAKGQIEIARLRAEDQRKIDEGQLTAQLLGHLASNNHLERAIAIAALRGSLQLGRFDTVLTVLARSDPSPEVREAAIERLGESGDTALAPILVKIARDTDRPESERVRAQTAIQQIEASANLPAGTLLVAAGAGAKVMESSSVRGGVFTHALVEGLQGVADVNGDGMVSAMEISQFVSANVSATTSGVQHPVFSLSGSDFAIRLAPRDPTKLAGLVVGISKYTNPYSPLLYAASDAQQVYDLLSSFPGSHRPQLTLLRDEEATRDHVLRQLDALCDSLPPESVLVFYFSGHGAHEVNARAGLVLSGDGQNPNSRLTIEEIKLRVGRSRARSKVLLLDASFAGDELAASR